MKKHISITLSEDLIDYLESNHVNKSSYIEALLRKNGINNRLKLNKEEEKILERT